VAKNKNQEAIEKLPGYLPPGKRPKCRNCGKELKPFILHRSEQYEKVDDSGHMQRYLGPLIPERVGYYGYDGNNLFCTLGCGYAYGVRAAKKGI
jgi:hypothetical protein